MKRIATFLLASALAATAAEAQVWRSVKIDRVLADSAPLNINVRFEEGTLELRRGENERAYSLSLSYDAQRVIPRHRFDSASRVLSLGTERHGSARLGGDYRGEARVDIPALIPANVSIDVGAASSTLDLGGLTLNNLHFRTGASQTVLRFDEPNRGPLQHMTIDGSAGIIRATGLANARAAAITVQAHLGAVDLDFGGEWTTDITADLRLVLARAVLHVPRDVGVEIEASRVLSSFNPEGFTRTGDIYRTSNWDSATRRLRITASSVLGSLSIERSAPSM
jgi:hypothetical protein